MHRGRQKTKVPKFWRSIDSLASEYIDYKNYRYTRLRQLSAVLKVPTSRLQRVCQFVWNFR